MRSNLDIAKLADEALAYVASEEARTKVATAPIVETHRTEIGKALKKAAELVAVYDDSQVTNEDLKAVKQGYLVPAKLAALQTSTKSGSDLGNKFRKMSQEILENGSTQEQVRLVKAAQMLEAAISLQHMKA